MKLKKFLVVFPSNSEFCFDREKFIILAAPSVVITDSIKNMKIEDLPDDFLLEVFNYLNAKSLKCSILVCKR